MSNGLEIQPSGAAWIAVASAEHVRRGVAASFIQVCHGKQGPLRRMRPGDLVATYSPTEQFRGPGALRSFTAIGRIGSEDIQQVDMGGGFRPFRRQVLWFAASPAPVRALQARPGFALSGAGWGARLRFGLLKIDMESMADIAQAMGVVQLRAESSVQGGGLTA
jgi:hypothetical protein